MKGLKATLSILLFFVAQANAQTDTTIQSLGEVVITSNRTTQQEAAIPYVVNNISKKQLQQFGARTTPEALMGMNGVFIQKTNHGGGSAFVRGLTGNQTLILLDGIRLNNSTFRYGPNQYLNTIDAYTIQKIEVAKGTGSVQYGTDALGGVIHVLSKEPELMNTPSTATTQRRRLNGIAITKFMSGNMEQTTRAELNYSGKSFAAIAGATVRNFGDMIGGDTTGKQSPSGYKEFAYDVKLKFRLNEHIQLTTAHNFLQQQQVPVYHKVLLENFAINEIDPQQRMLNYAKLAITHQHKLMRSIELIVSHQQTIEGRNSRKNGSTVLRKEKDEVNTVGFTVDVNSVLTKYWTANSGIELYYDKVLSKRDDIDQLTNTTSSKRGQYPHGSTYGNYSIFSLHHFQLKQFRIDAGLRYNLFGIRIADTSLGKVYIKPSALVGNLAVSYNIHRNHYFFASFNSGYRAPNVDDMGTLGVVDFRYEIPAADLLPERSFNYEAGYKFRSKKISATVNVFYMQLQQLITRVKVDGEQINGYNVYKKENTEDAFIRGTEAELDWLILKGWSVNAGMAYLFAANTTKDEPLRRIPPFNGRVRSTYQKNKWFAAAELWFADQQDRLAQGDKDDNRIPKGGTPGFKVLNLYAGYELNQYLKFNTGLQNLFNADYRTHGSGINGYGRSAWLNIQFMF